MNRLASSSKGLGILATGAFGSLYAIGSLQVWPLRGLRSFLKEKLEGVQFLSLAQLYQRALACESRSKEIQKSARHNIHAIEGEDSGSDDKSSDVYATEFVWTNKNKSHVCTSLKLAAKSWQEEFKFTFDVTKCDRIFYELLKSDKIKISHVILSGDELKKWAYCKWHNSYSYATNDCLVFRRQVQSAINERRLSFPEMQIDKQPFPAGTYMLELSDKKVLTRPKVVNKAKTENIVIGDPRAADGSTKVPHREVVAQRTPDGKETLKITIQGGGGRSRGKSRRAPQFQYTPDNPAAIG